MSPAISTEKQRLIDTLMEHVTSAPTPAEITRRARVAIAVLLKPTAAPQHVPLLEAIVDEYAPKPAPATAPTAPPDFGRGEFDNKRKKMIAQLAKKLLNAMSAGGNDAEKLGRVRQLLEPLSLLSESIMGPNASPFSRRMVRSLAPTSLVEQADDGAESFRESLYDIIDQPRPAADKLAEIRALCKAHADESLLESKSFAAVGAYPEAKNPFTGK